MRSADEILIQLKDIQLPPAPETTFPLLPTVTLGLSMLCITGACFLFIKRRKTTTVRIHLGELELLQANLHTSIKTLRSGSANNDKSQHQEEKEQEVIEKQSRDLAALLRSFVANTQTENENYQTNTMSGMQWQNYLDDKFNTSYFTSGDGIFFGDALYSTNPGEHLELLKQAGETAVAQTPERLLIVCQDLTMLLRRYEKRMTWFGRHTARYDRFKDKNTGHHLAVDKSRC